MKTDHWIVWTTADALAFAPPEALPTVVVIPDLCDRTLMATLLAQDGVAGLVVTRATAPCLAGDPRLGLLLPDGEWTLPTTRARSLLLLKDQGTVGARRARIALRAGITILIRRDAAASWHLTSLWSWMGHKWMERMIHGVTSRMSSDLRHRIMARRLAALVRHPGLPADHFVAGRVVLVTGNLGAGGAERQATQTALALAKAGCDITLWCQNLGAERDDFFLPLVEPYLPVRRVGDLFEEILVAVPPAKLEPLRTHLHDLNLAALEGLLPGGQGEKVISHAAKLLLERPAVVHLWQDYPNVVGGLAAILVGVPRIVLGMRNLAPHHFSYFQPFMAPIYRLLAQQPNVVMLNNSAHGAADYAAWLGIDPARIRVLHNGVDDELCPPPAAAVAAWRQSIPLPADARVVGGILRLAPEKNPLLWLETAAVVAKQRPDVLFLLVGDGPLRPEALRHAMALGLGNRLYMPGVVNEIRLPIALMDVLLLSSRQEGLPNVLIEAQILGCPVVTTDAGGSRETIDHGRTGWVVEDHDPRALAERLLQVLNDEAWRRQASIAARSFARSRFGMGRMMAETMDVYGMVPSCNINQSCSMSAVQSG